MKNHLGLLAASALVALASTRRHGADILGAARIDAARPGGAGGDP